MRLLVTGAAGFIGSHLVEALLREGHAVLGLDNFCDFYDPQIKYDNLSQALEHPSFSLVVEDILHEESLKARFAAFQPELVLHLAAMAGVRPSIQRPGLYTDVNVRGTLNVLEATVHSGATRFIFASSSSVYGNTPRVPFHEDEPAARPISPYAATKRAAELLCHTYHHLHGLSVACLRLFTVYGPRQRPDLAIHKFSRLLLAGRPLPLYGDGSSRRDYTYVEDTVAGILGAVNWIAHDESLNGVFNLGESHTVSLAELVGLLEQALGKTARIERQPDQPGDVRTTYADITRARTILGYAPEISIEVGIQRFAEWLRR